MPSLIWQAIKQGPGVRIEEETCFFGCKIPFFDWRMKKKKKSPLLLLHFDHRKRVIHNLEDLTAARLLWINCPLL